MARATGTNHKRKRINRTKPLGKRWGATVQEIVTKEAAKQARALLKAGKYTSDNEVEAKIPVFIHLRFARKGRGIAADGPVVRCACTFTQYPDGSSVCICRGPDAADCDCGPIVA
jgi:hypothetical protein